MNLDCNHSIPSNLGDDAYFMAALVLAQGEHPGVERPRPSPRLEAEPRRMYQEVSQEVAIAEHGCVGAEHMAEQGGVDQVALRRLDQTFIRLDVHDGSSWIANSFCNGYR